MLRIRNGLLPWSISAMRTFSTTLGAEACIMSSIVSAIGVSISGFIRPQTTPRKEFIHSTDSGRRFAVAYRKY